MREDGRQRWKRTGQMAPAEPKPQKKSKPKKNDDE